VNFFWYRIIIYPKLYDNNIQDDEGTIIGTLEITMLDTW